MNTRSKLTFAVGLGILMLALTASLHLARKADAIESQAYALQSSDSEYEQVTAEIERLRAKLDELANREASSKEESHIPKLTTYATSSSAEPNVLSDWLERVEHLSSYLSANQSLAIPEMENLTPSDWLDVTKFRTIETDADFRIAIAKLRQIAKQRQADPIHQAFLRYLEDSNGELPAKSNELLAYSNGAFDQSIIERYRINPTGKLSEHSHTSDAYLVETDEFVDPLWNSRFHFTDNLSYGVYPVQEYKQKRLIDTLQNFEAEHGRSPFNSDELKPLLPEDYKEDLPQLLESVTSLAEL